MVVVVVGRMSSSCKIAIVGGGLAVANALKRLGTKAEVFETAPALGEIGAAVNTSPQAVKASLARQPRILEVEEIKSISYMLVSRSFVQRLIGTVHVNAWRRIDRCAGDKKQTLSTGTNDRPTR
jgi:hypothetical protein